MFGRILIIIKKRAALRPWHSLLRAIVSVCFRSIVGPWHVIGGSCPTPVRRLPTFWRSNQRRRARTTSSKTNNKQVETQVAIKVAKQRRKTHQQNTVATSIAKQAAKQLHNNSRNTVATTSHKTCRLQACQPRRKQTTNNKSQQESHKVSKELATT